MNAYMQTKIETRLTGMKVGCVATLWDLLVWRVSAENWVIGHTSISLSDKGMSLAAASEKFERLLD